jgi:hypothetical protein
LELLCDGIVSRDSLQHTRVIVCYDSNTITYKTDSEEWTKKILRNEIEKNMEIKKTNSIREIRSNCKVNSKKSRDYQEEIINKSKIDVGVYLVVLQLV